MSERPRYSPENQPSIILPEIDKKLRVLKRFETDLKDPEVEQAKTAMHTVIAPHLPWLNDQNIVATYHGSLQYGDPRNLDVDIALISEDLKYEAVASLISALEKAFVQPGAWPRETSETDLYYVSITEIRRELAQLQGKKRYSYARDFDRYYADMDSSFILSSALLFEEQRSLLSRYQNEIRVLVQNNPWLKGGIINSLNRAIKIRQERRRELGLTFNT